MIAPGSGLNAGILQFSALNQSTLKVGAPLIDAHGYFNGSATALQVIVGRSDRLGDEGGANFSLSHSGNAFTLSFTPVPEPSTHALLAPGLGFIGLTVWRQRRT